MLNTEKIRGDFKLFEKKEGVSAPIYFDSACMSLKPNQVVKAMNDYYFNFPSCGNRGVYEMAGKVTEKVKEARRLIAKFVNALHEDEIIFTRNTTE